MNFLKKIKANWLIDAICTVIIGLVLVFWPGATLEIICKALAIILMLAGVVMVVGFIFNHDGSIATTANFALGVIVAVIGGFIFFRPSVFIDIVPIMAGVIIAVSGIIKLGQSISLAKRHYERWWLALVFAMITIGLGAFLVLNPTFTAEVVVRVIGCFLVFDGISNIWIISRVAKMNKLAKQELEAVEVSATETIVGEEHKDFYKD